MLKFFILFVMVLNTTFASDVPIVGASRETGILGGEINRIQTCRTFTEPTCLKLINNTDKAVAFTFNFPGPWGDHIASGKVLVKNENGIPQCVFTGSPSGTQCVSVLGPGEHGWVMFPETGIVMVTVSGWTVPGLVMRTLSVIPDTTVRAEVLGDRDLVFGSALPASKSWSRTCEVDLNMRGANTLFVNVCR